jgi:uncharacterized protein (DUF2252 family)
MRDAIAEFIGYNRPFARRNPELVRYKIARMAGSPFAFFRGTFHLFARDILDRVFDPLMPPAGDRAELDLVGDIHNENFGTFQAADGVVHFDINDFDETTQGRFDFDVRRLAVSQMLAARERGDRLEDAVQGALAFVRAYSEATRRLLKKGKDLDWDVSENKPANCAALDDLIRTNAAARRGAFIDRLTEYDKGRRRLKRSAQYFNVPVGEFDQALELLEDYRKRRKEQVPKGFYDVEDVAGRVSGIGSMGRLRYAVLLAGKGSRDARNVLLEFKEARPSAYDLYRQRQTDDTALQGRAERVITVQTKSQAASPSRLGCAVTGSQSFQVRELRPQDGRLDSKGLKNAAEFQEVARVQAAILARTHARAAGRALGPSNPLAEIADADKFCQQILAFALAYAELTVQDWTRFVAHRQELDQCERWAAEGSSP